MDLTRYVNTFGRYLQEKHGERIHKLSVNAAFTCPNRDGAKGIGGCTFCNNRSFSPNSTNSELSVSAQLAAAREKVVRVRKARKFRPISNLLKYIRRSATAQKTLRRGPGRARCRRSLRGHPSGLCSRSRAGAAGFLSGARQEVWLELGLQSSFDNTLERINRGHTFADYEDAILRAKKYDLNICTHLIMGLPR